MSLIFTNSENYSNIANAIRSKTGGSNTYLPSEMAEAIENLSVGGSQQTHDAFDSFARFVQLNVVQVNGGVLLPSFFGRMSVSARKTE